MSLHGPAFKSERGSMDNQVDLSLIYVYVVDDQKIITSTLTAILAQNGYSSIGFTNPLEALESATVQPPAILIADVIMPEMNGIELGIEFKSRFPNCNVLLLSGQTHTTDLLEIAKERGHNFSIVAKPIHPRELLAAIAHLTTESQSESHIACATTNTDHT
jgi:DNA-binding NtrC family response regulator